MQQTTLTKVVENVLSKSNFYQKFLVGEKIILKDTKKLHYLRVKLVEVMRILVVNFI